MARNLNKKGLRRDLNFADIPDPDQALNNLLNNLTPPGIKDDIDPIQGIGSTSMRNEDFLNIRESAIRITNEQGNIDEVFDPLIKVKNQFDIAEFATGEPQFFGGDGLTARYYSEEYINSEATSVENIFTTPTDGEVYEEIFWENGYFNFEGKINENFLTQYGGVEWNGYFRPTRSGRWNMSYHSTAFFTVEFDDGNGNLELHTRKSQLDYSFTVAAATAGDTELVLEDPANIIYLLTGDILINNSISQFVEPDIEAGNEGVTITRIVDRDLGKIELSAPLDQNVAAGTSFIFRFQYGQEDGSSSFTTPNMEEYQSYKIRLRFWYPNKVGNVFSSNENVKVIRFWANEPGIDNDGASLNYKYLQSESYNRNPSPGTVAYGDFKDYFDNKIPLGGGTIGGTSGYNSYESVLSLSPINIKYEPPKSLADVISQEYTLTHTSGENYLPMSITDGIEVGNYVFSNGVTIGTRVKEITTNRSVFLDANVTSSGSKKTRFIDHRGVSAIAYSGTWSNGGTTISGLTTNFTDNVSLGDVIICNGSAQYATVTAKTATSVIVSKAFTADSGTTINAGVIAYKPSGIQNTTLGAFCTNVYSSKTVSASVAGATTLVVEPNANIVEGQVVQFGTAIPNGTIVGSIVANDINTFSSNTASNVALGSNKIVVKQNSNIESGQEISYGNIYPSDTSVSSVTPISTFCNGVEASTTIFQASSGRVIEVELNNGIEVNQVVEYLDRLPSGTTVESIEPFGFQQYTITAAVAISSGSDKIVVNDDSNLETGHYIQSNNAYPEETTVATVELMTSFCGDVSRMKTAGVTLEGSNVVDVTFVSEEDAVDFAPGYRIQSLDPSFIPPENINRIYAIHKLQPLTKKSIVTYQTNRVNKFNVPDDGQVSYNYDDLYLTAGPFDDPVFQPGTKARSVVQDGVINGQLQWVVYTDKTMNRPIREGELVLFHPDPIENYNSSFYALELESGVEQQMGADEIVLLDQDSFNFGESKALCYPSEEITYTTEKLIRTSAPTNSSISQNQSINFTILGTASYLKVTLSADLQNGGIEANSLVVFKPAGTTESKALCYPEESVLQGTDLLIETSAAATSTISVGETVDFISISPTSTYTINLTDDQDQAVSLVREIPVDQIITFAPSGTTDSKEICFPQEDVSAPFISTEDGMRTPSTNPTMEISPTGGAVGVLKFQGLSVDMQVDPQQVDATSEYNRELVIKDVFGNTFKILGTTL